MKRLLALRFRCPNAVTGAFALLLSFCALLAMPVSAARLSAIQGSAIGCTYKLEGPISPGDATRVQAETSALETGAFWEFRGRVCFSSPGGSYLEAIEIARVLRNIPTGVDRGDQCESACFIAFMAGSFPRLEDRTPVPDRVMHPTAKVGFHAPRLSVPAGRYNEAAIQLAYKVALLSIAELIKFREENKQYRFRDRLLDDMLRVDASDMRYVETVGDAALWDITVYPVVLPDRISLAKSAQACRALGRIAEDFSVSNAYQRASFSGSGAFPIFQAFFNVGESASNCTIRYRIETATQHAAGPRFSPDWSIGNATVTDWYIDVNDFEVAVYMHYPFDTRIADLSSRPDHKATNRRLLASRKPDQQRFERCTVSSSAQVTGVAEFANLRASPTLNARVTGRAKAGEFVTVLAIGSERFRAITQSCDRACRTSSGRTSGAIESCILDHRIWIKIRTVSGGEGYISRKFLRQE